jgi:sulfur-oxidizing protein SoxA
MRFRRGFAALAAIAALSAAPLAAAPEDVRREMVQRLRELLPGIAPADHALGSAAFDAELRARREAQAAEAKPILEAGRKLWQRRFKNGRSLANCFPNGGKRVAAAYPQYDSRLRRVVTLEMAINQCLKSHGEAILEHDDPKTMGLLVAHLRSLAVGQKIAVRVPAAAQQRLEQGRSQYFARRGQRNYACASCHVQGAGKRFLDTPLSPAVGQATHWPLVRDGAAITLQAKMRECLELMGAAPFPAGSEDLNHLEYYLTFLSNGLPIAAPPWREGGPAKP